MAQTISLPELGEGITEGTIISVLVKEGSNVKEGDTVVEIETDKAVLGVPINATGTLVKWFVKEGDTLKVGGKLCSLDTEGGTSTKEKPDPKNSQKQEKEEVEKAEEPPTPSKESDKSDHSATVEKEINFDGLGEGEGGTVISLAVKKGDKLSKGDTLLELETDKAVVPFPSPDDGVITQVFVKEGQEIKAGDKAFLISATSSASSPSSPTDEVQAEESHPPIPPALSTLSESPKPESASQPSSPSVTSPVDLTHADFSSVHAGPATRKLARELGVDLNRVTGSGRNGRISIEDVKGYTKSVLTGSGPQSFSPSAKEIPDFSQWGTVRREKTSKLRDTIARAISYAWQTVPHVHQNDNVNIDNILGLQKKWKQSFEEKGSTLSVTPFIVKALAQCLRDFPQFNSSYDPGGKEIIFKEYYHIGVAVDTPQGLIVPVIKDVDKLNIFEIGVRLKTIAAQTRERTVKPEDLRGGCITLSNLGGIGGTHFNPIVNWPEVAILGVGRGTIQPIYNKDKGDFRPAMMLPACLAYDHRVVDGADGARFMVKLKHYLENPDLLLMGMK